MTKLDKWFLTRLKKDKSLETWMPTKVVFSDEGMKPWAGGYCRYKFMSNYIQIREKYEGVDNGILAHELTHAKQYGNLWFIHLILKNFDKYTLFIELDAYREQVKLYNYKKKGDYMWIVNSLTNPDKYGLKISIADAIEYADYMFEDLIEFNKNKEN